MAKTSRYTAHRLLCLGSSGFQPTRLTQSFTDVGRLLPEIICVAAPATTLVVPRANPTIRSEAYSTLLCSPTLPSVSWHAGTARRMTRATCTNTRNRSTRFRLGKFLLPTRLAQILTVVARLLPEIVRCAAPATALIITCANPTVRPEAYSSLACCPAPPFMSRNARAAQRMTRATCTDTKLHTARCRLGKFGLRLINKRSGLRLRRKQWTESTSPRAHSDAKILSH